MNRPTSQLNTRDGIVLCQGSSRGVFQPLTRSARGESPASRPSIRGISAGSSCPSPSSITIRSPRQHANPAARAADLPCPRSRRMPRTRLSANDRASISAHEPSVEPSSIRNSSQEMPAASRAVRISAASGAMLPASSRTGTTSDAAGVVMAVATGGLRASG